MVLPDIPETTDRPQLHSSEIRLASHWIVRAISTSRMRYMASFARYQPPRELSPRWLAMGFGRIRVMADRRQAPSYVMSTGWLLTARATSILPIPGTTESARWMPRQALSPLSPDPM